MDKRQTQLGFFESSCPQTRIPQIIILMLEPCLTTEDRQCEDVLCLLITGACLNLL